MTTFPGSPRLTKGAIVGIDPTGPPPSVTVFQYNPDTLTRTLQARTAGGDGRGPVRLSGPPEQTIKLSIELDATDQLERSDPLAAAMGVQPALAALEILLYPSSASVVANEVLVRAGIIEIIPAEAPLTLLVWGPRRTLPVRITDFSVTEQAFDVDLNPIRASVDLGLSVLTYYDIGLLSPGGALFMAHQVATEAMAAIGGSGQLPAGTATGLPR